MLLPQRYKFSSKSQHSMSPNFIVNCCCCYRKGTNFQANHNTLSDVKYLLSLLLLPQRYKFSSKSQPTRGPCSSGGSCCCYRKGTNFQANHNYLSSECLMRIVVVATAKVQIFKQITTIGGYASLAIGCCCYRKGTNFQANHNCPLSPHHRW